MAGCEKILHQSVLELDKKDVNVTLTPKYIAVEHLVKQKQCDDNLLDVKQGKLEQICAVFSACQQKKNCSNSVSLSQSMSSLRAFNTISYK